MSGSTEHELETLSCYMSQNLLDGVSQNFSIYCKIRRTFIYIAKHFILAHEVMKKQLAIFNLGFLVVTMGHLGHHSLPIHTNMT